MSKRNSFLSLVILLLLSVIFLSGCTLKLPELFPEEIPVSNLPSESLFIDKEAIYSQTVSLINSAQTSIYVEQAVFDDPQLIQMLITKSNSGVDVRVLLDQWQKANRVTLDQLKSQNVSVQYYPAQKGQINHTKYLIVDQKRALIYGPAWTEEGFRSHDLAVELSGRSAWKAASVFSKDWEFTTTFSLEDVEKSSPLPDDNIILATNANVRQQLIEHIQASTKSIWIETTEITDPDLKDALITAAENGYDVRLILEPSLTTKTPVTVEDLRSKGVQIRFYPSDPPLGMNLVIFDNSGFILSSSGWTKYSFLANHEFSVTVPSPAASQKLADMFNQDWEKSSVAKKAQ
ncbi:phosphatidylserine/phosphatidylglycerophosphate/cardiolipin synthase [Desulfosporosinus orientis DSM 765]|uniref:phospholipase D n=1 Tax=Desulfosporosinus orientis (strain ATCC 19365 / DSM 765 / NCIMB 8382 / VKM B-1628 / Singapore I) TaxID=768706 RepID=G7WDT9_DESOD|nr:phosphatidylserine/phosphatidylglycerophosphate/cardiolipin synthase family protein [Desulfosporosinus orientis]AET68846.1 phosphatidylserine/phosphatidylglycerophosphate/cardiolipin synthase [Desulfosporosinus orientis DSM 765]